LEGIASFFHFSERKTSFWTEVRAGVTTFLVMVYILAVNAGILSAGLGLDPAAVAAGTALVAGVMTIAMGLATNYPFALAAGLGLNAAVAFSLPALGLSPAGAMGVIVTEGIVITVLVLGGFREAVMNAVPLGLKRSIGVGIGLFILFIGFVDGGLITTPQGGVPIVGFVFPTQNAQWVFLLGLLITIALWSMKVKGALIISIIATTVVALVTNVTSIPDGFKATPDAITFSTLGNFDLGNVWSLGAVAAVLVIFSIMLSDFFDTMGTVTGVAAEAGLTESDGSVPGVGRVLLVDSLAAVAGGAAGISSNTTYIESAAGVGDGGRTGLTSVVTGALFLLAIFLSPLASLVPAAATAPALVLVGYLMFMQIREVDPSDFEIGFPALLTITLMPLTYSITNGIGAGFVSWVVIQIARGKAGQIHWLMWVVSIAFAIYFAQEWIKPFIT
jgi:AGZA family xanthine/uracil permease-like MFS transporter